VTYGGRFELLSDKGQSHRVSLAPKGPLYIDRFSDPMTPTRATCAKWARARCASSTPTPCTSATQFKFGKYERVKITLKDGFVLEGAITYPPNFDPEKKVPGVAVYLRGPHSPTLRDEWGGGRVMEQSLATSGIITFRVDPRSASGKGAQSAWACYKQLGVQELKDLEEAVMWLAEKPYIDAKRVGISGHSYGGFMARLRADALENLLGRDRSGPVTDWKLYDTIYTERYMLTAEGERGGLCEE